MPLFLPSAFQPQQLPNISKCEVVVEQKQLPTIHEPNNVQCSLADAMLEYFDTDWHDTVPPIHELASSETCNILKKHPHLITQLSTCEMEGVHWANLLRIHPHLALYCKWSTLDGWDTQYLIRKQPELIHWCNLDLLDDMNWEEIFRRQPQLRSAYQR